eukprot:150901_1
MAAHNDTQTSFLLNQYNVMSLLEDLWDIQESDRNDGIKLLSKIFTKLLNNLSESKKYGDLNCKKIRQKFDKCKPAFSLLCSAGFKESNDGKRIIWKYTDGTIKALNNTYNALRAKIDEQHNDKNKLKAIKELVDAGFSTQEAIDAIDLSANLNATQSNNRNDKYVSSNNCVAASKCKSIINLSLILNKYISKEREIGDIEVENSVIVSTLDSFHHFLNYHNRENTVFYSVYKLFDGDNCDAFNCKEVERRFRKKINENNENIKKCIFMEVLETIHCHIMHSYETGHRLTEKELIHIQNIDDQKQTELNQLNIIRLKQILNDKHEVLIKELKIKNEPYRQRQNKFNTNLNQMKIENDNKQIIAKYSYSYLFFYKETAKHSTQQRYNGRDCDLYIPPKYDTFKEELTSNPICSISINVWNGCIQRAECLIKTENAKQTCANTQKHETRMQYGLDHPIHFGFLDGLPITINHLISLDAYCRFDILQNKFSATFRSENKQQTFQDIMDRHSNYHFFAKYLKESVQVFGTEYEKGRTQRMYHGIDKKMIFDSTSPEIFGPLSTSYSHCVAVQFSKSTGMILELVPNGSLKYFECEWISPFSQEGELLFMGGFGAINFVNITYISGASYEALIKSLRIIESMADGVYFLNDPSDNPKIRYSETRHVKSLKLQPLHPMFKIFCLALILHKLHRNGYNKIYDEQLRRNLKAIPSLDPYSEQILDALCCNKMRIAINMQTMNVDILKHCSNVGGGYIGYKFLQTLFCSKENDALDINTIYALFPNIIMIRVFDLIKISSNFMDQIYEFLSIKNSNVWYIELNVLKESGHSNISEQCIVFKSMFQIIEYEVFETQNPGYKTQCIVIKRCGQQ